MTLDQPTFQGGAKPGSSDAATTLSQAAFANPLEFLQVLQKDYSKIASHGGDMSKNDLILYAQQGDDAEGRRAAKVAVEHFDTLMSMTVDNHSDDNGNKPAQVISRYDLKQDISYEKGTVLSLAPEIVVKELADASMTAIGAGFTLVGAELTMVSAVACPPVLAIAVPVTVGSAGIMGYSAYHFATDAFTTAASAKHRQQEFASWSEINRGQAKPGAS